MILSEDEIRDLTGKQRSDAQRRELDWLGVPYKVRRDGTLIVMREALAPKTVVGREPRLRL